MNVMVWQVTNWSQWRAVPSQVDLVALLMRLKKSPLLTLPPTYHHHCSLKSSPSHFLPFYLNQCASGAWFLPNCSHLFWKLKLTDCLFFGLTSNEELGCYLGCLRVAAVHMSCKLVFPPAVYTTTHLRDVPGELQNCFLQPQHILSKLVFNLCALGLR